MNEPFKFDKNYPKEYEYMGLVAVKCGEMIKSMDKEILHYITENMPEKDFPVKFSRDYKRLGRIFSGLEDAKFAFYRKIRDSIYKELDTACKDPKIRLWVRHSVSSNMNIQSLTMPHRDQANWGLFKAVRDPRKSMHAIKEIKQKDDEKRSHDGLSSSNPTMNLSQEPKPKISSRFLQTLNYTTVYRDKNPVVMNKRNRKLEKRYQEKYNYLEALALKAQNMTQHMDQEIINFVNNDLAEERFSDATAKRRVNRFAFTSLEKAKTAFQRSIHSSIEKQIKYDCPDYKTAHRIRRSVYLAIKKSSLSRPKIGPEKYISGIVKEASHNVSIPSDPVISSPQKPESEISKRFAQTLSYNTATSKNNSLAKNTVKIKNDKDRE